MWMIFVRRGTHLDSYPAVRAHLEQHRKELEPRPLDVPSKGWLGRKPGSYKWFEIQDAVDYHELFEQPKLLYPDILWRADFCLAPADAYTNNTAYLLPSEDLWLLACLNSPAMWAYLWRTAQHAKDEALRMFGEYLVTVPIPVPSAELRDHTALAVTQSIEQTRAIQLAKADVLDVLRLRYGVERFGQKLEDFDQLGSEDFLREASRRFDKKKPVPLSALRELRTLFDTEVPGILAQRSKLLALEKQIAAAVHAAYQLTPEDLAVMKETQPPRMPPGFGSESVPRTPLSSDRNHAHSD
jgi:hypothetical protein